MKAKCYNDMATTLLVEFCTHGMSDLANSISIALTNDVTSAAPQNPQHFHF